MVIPIQVWEIHMDILIYIFSNAFADVYYGGIDIRMEKNANGYKVI